MVVVGASGGIGGALVSLLEADPRVGTLHAWSRQPVEPAIGKIRAARIDITDENSIAEAAALLDRPRLVIVATGLLHAADGFRPERTWRELDFDKLARSFAVNAIGPALVAKHILPLLPQDERAVFAALSARVGSIGDNRLGGWYGYRASKAALNQLIKTFSIELARRHSEAVCVGLHPGTVDTALSKPFQGSVPARQLFESDKAARQLLTVLDGLNPSDTGNLFDWDGSRVPF